MLRHLLILLSLSTALFAAERPSIIYINADDLGWADVSYNGSTYYETPNIDRIAKEGIAFTYGYASAANCAPSRACALSGQNTPRHGVYTVANSDRGQAKDRKLVPTPNTLFLKDGNLTFAHILGEAGYATATMGKWHITKNPLNNGFDINIAGTSAGGPYTGGYHSPFNYPNLKIDEPGDFLTDKITDRAIDFITENKDKPFLLYLPYYAVHTPIQSKQKLIEKYQAKSPSATQSDAKYAALIETLDTNIGRVLDTLDQLKLTDNTLLVFTSDNGGVNAISSQRPLRGGKGLYYEGGIRVPLFLRWPHQITAGSVNETPVSNLDFFPTFCAAAKAPIPENKILDGTSLHPLFKQKEIPPRALYWHFPIYLQAFGGKAAMADAQDPKFRTRPGSAIRLGNYKLIHYFENNDLELYNLTKDPSEQNNLSKTHPEKTQELLTKLKKWRVQTNAPVPKHN